MNEQPSIPKLIFSYLLIIIITGVLVIMDGVDKTFAHNSMDANEHAIVDSIAIINAEANLPIYAVTDEHSNAKSLSVERMQEQATIDSAIIEKHPAAEHDHDVELRSNLRTRMELRERIDEVNERIQQLTDSMPAPVSRLSSVDQLQPSAINEESVNAKSPWVVNLVSLSNKAAADRFSTKARSRDIQAEWYAVTVKGKQYWRVHASGFSTAAEAKSQANIIKEKLGLKDVWITKR